MEQLPLEVYTSDEVKFIEAEHAKEHNGHCFDLMQQAGKAVFDFIVRECAQAKDVWIFCGKGNNGGDGYIVANLLLENSINHRVFATGVPHEGTEASIAYEYYVRQGGIVEYELPNHGQLPDDGVIAYSAPDVIVDALLGTGTNSSPKGDMAKWIAYINQLNTYVVSIDIPSGVIADTGSVPGMCVSADATVCMLALKPGLLTSDAVDFVGKLEFAPLGVQSYSYYDVFDYSKTTYPVPIMRMSYKDIKPQLPVRLPSFNKGDNGKVLIIAGASGFGGAAILCGTGALRSGAGLVKVALEKDNYQALLSVRPELMTVDLNSAEALQKAIDWADVIAVGPGLGVNERTQRILDTIDDVIDKYVVYDADALNVLSKYEEKFYNENRVITPHPGEAARLLGCTVEAINADRLGSCYKLWQKFGGVVLLKGAGTIVCDGNRLSIINEGSPALATGGSGDLLTGIIASLIAQGLGLEMGVIVGACIHARAGAICGQKEGVIGTLPLDVSKYIRELVNGRD